MLRTIKLTAEKKNMAKTPDELYNYCTLKTIRSPNKPALSVAKLSIFSEMNKHKKHRLNLLNENSSEFMSRCLVIHWILKC